MLPTALWMHAACAWAFNGDADLVVGACGVGAQDFTKCDFGPIRDMLEQQKQERKAKTKDEKEEAKVEKEALQRRFGYALVDGNRVEKVRALPLCGLLSAYVRCVCPVIQPPPPPPPPPLPGLMRASTPLP